VQTDVNDDYWSVNIKKGLLSLFQLKINGRSTISTSSSSQDSESFLSSESIRERNRFYELVNPLERRSRSLTTDNILKVMEVRAARRIVAVYQCSFAVDKVMINERYLLTYLC